MKDTSAEGQTDVKHKDTKERARRSLSGYKYICGESISAAQKVSLSSGMFLDIYQQKSPLV